MLIFTRVLDKDSLTNVLILVFIRVLAGLQPHLLTHVLAGLQPHLLTHVLAGLQPHLFTHVLAGLQPHLLTHVLAGLQPASGCGRVCDPGK